METWTRQGDREALPPGGPWIEEPDKAVWIDPLSGLDCMINRHTEHGNLCGYVGIGPNHPLHGVGFAQALAPVCAHFREAYEPPEEIAEAIEGLSAIRRRMEDSQGWQFTDCWECPTPDHLLEVHGGLTFSGGCHEGLPPAEGICHVPQPGRPDDVWWFGFDCGHAFDLQPSLEAYMERVIPSMRQRHQELRELAKDDGHDMWRVTYRDFPYVIGEVTRLAFQLSNYQLALTS